MLVSFVLKFCVYWLCIIIPMINDQDCAVCLGDGEDYYIIILFYILCG